MSIHYVLSRRIQLRECMPEIFPVLCRVHVEEGYPQPVVERPPQRQGPRLAGNQLCDDGAVAGNLHVDSDIGLAFYVDHLGAMLRLRPALRRLVSTLRVESFNVDVRYSRADVGKSPGDSLIVAHDHIRHSREGYAGNVESSGLQVRFIPEVGHLMAEMHIV